jgi:hypothetical protein
MKAIITCLVTSCCLFFAMPRFCTADPPPAVIERGKAATALILDFNGRPMGVACCIDASGLFVTNLPLTPGAKIDLALLPGQEGERKVSAVIVQKDKNPLHAVLRVDGVKGLVALERRPTDVVETQQLVLFGVVTVPGVVPKKLPPIRVDLTRVRSLRGPAGRLDEIEVDARRPQLHSGGPLLDDDGRLVGVAHFEMAQYPKGTFVTPIGRIDESMKTPQIIFPEQPVKLAYRNKAHAYDFHAELLGNRQRDLQFDVELSSRPGERRTFKAEARDDSYRVTVVPVPPEEDQRVTLDVVFEGGTLKLEVPDAKILLDDKALRLSELDRLDRRTGAVLLADGSTLKAEKTRLGKISTELGGKPVSLDLDSALAITVLPGGPPSRELRYRVIARRDGTVVATREGVIALEVPAALAPATLELEPQPPAGAPQKIPAPKLDGGKQVVELGEPFSQVCTGGCGRYLVFHLPKARQLAVVDVSEAKLIGRIDMPADEVSFAAGLDRLLVALPEQRLLLRWNLAKLQKERTVALPGEDAIGAVRMGCSTRNPLFLFQGRQLAVWDVEQMRPIDIKGKGLTPGPGPELQFRVSAGGQTVVDWHLPVGYPSYALLRLDGSRAMVLTGVDGPRDRDQWAQPSADGSLIFRHDGGVYAWNLKPIAASALKGATLLPCEDPRFFLALREKPGKLMQTELCTTADRRSVFAIDGLEPLSFALPPPLRGNFKGEPRVRYLPSANLLVALPESNDRVVLRKFDLMAALDESGKDYLFVASVSPSRVRAGTSFVHPLEVRARNKGLTYTLDVGPKGMSVSNEGVIRWEVPGKLAATPIRVAITIRDERGKEALHVFELTAEP